MYPHPPHLFRHDPLEGGAGVVVLPHLHEEDPDVVHDLDPQSLVSVGHLAEKVIVMICIVHIEEP